MSRVILKYPDRLRLHTDAVRALLIEGGAPADLSMRDVTVELEPCSVTLSCQRAPEVHNAP